MSSHLLALTTLLLSSVSVEGYGILKRTQADIDIEGILPPSSLVPKAEDLPEAFSWRSVPGVGSLLTPGGNQHIPQYCGACYAFGSLHTLQDRVKVARYLMDFDSNFKPHNHESPDYIAAVQVLLNCNDRACSGGSVAGAWEFVRDFQGGGIPTEGCMRYEASDKLNCDPINVCRNCMGSALFTDAHPQYQCFAVPADESLTVPCFGDLECLSNPYPRLGVKEFGKLPKRNEAAIKREIASRGPVACAVDAMGMLNSDGKTILQDSPELAAKKLLPHSRVNSKNLTDHIIEVVGWGVDEKTKIPFWEIRNSWGEYWADGGFVKVRRGRNDLLIESDCMWVIPSGWGTPSHWETYNSKKVDRAAKELMTSDFILSANGISNVEALESERSLWFSLFFLSSLIIVSISVLAYQAKNSAAKKRRQEINGGYPAVIEMNAPLNRLRPFSQTQSYTSI